MDGLLLYSKEYMEIVAVRIKYKLDISICPQRQISPSAGENEKLGTEGMTFPQIIDSKLYTYYMEYFVAKRFKDSNKMMNFCKKSIHLKWYNCWITYIYVEVIIFCCSYVTIQGPPAKGSLS